MGNYFLSQFYVSATTVQSTGDMWVNKTKFLSSWNLTLMMELRDNQQKHNMISSGIMCSEKKYSNIKHKKCVCVLSDEMILEERFPWNERAGQVISWGKSCPNKG